MEEISVFVHLNAAAAGEYMLPDRAEWSHLKARGMLLQHPT
jgi:hypothetical protein